MRQKRISRLASILMGLVGLFAIFWFAEYSTRIFSHVFLADWSAYRWVDDDLEVTRSMRFMASLLYVPFFVLAGLQFATAWRLLDCYRNLIIFDLRPARLLIILGILMSLVLPMDAWISAYEPVYFSQWNADGQVPWRFHYDAGDFTVALSGLAFCLIGWITREGLYLRQENEAFV